MNRLSVFVLLVASVLGQGAAASPREVVRVDSGRLEGIAASDVVSFKGIP